MNPAPDYLLTLVMLAAVVGVIGVGLWSIEPVWPWQRRLERWRMRRRYPAVFERVERGVRR